MRPSQPGTVVELSRELGLPSALAIGVGTMIAAGIFTLSGLAVRDVGSAAIAAFLLAAVVASFTALTYCEFSALYPESGEGYLYARQTFPPPAAFFVGWCLLLGYTSSCAFYLASFSAYFQEFLWHSPVKMAAGFAALAALTLLNIKGTKESGTFQVVVTAGKLLLLLWFVAGGIGQLDGALLLEKFSRDVPRIASTAALVFITFFGFSAIAASAGEIRDPGRIIPRAIFLSVALVTVLYTLVVAVVAGAGLREYSEAAMGRAAELFLGPLGGLVIVGGALFSMISAANASIMAGSRVALAMAREGHLPASLASVHPITRTPLVSVTAVGMAILVFMAALHLEQLAHFADIVLLLALILVNLALIFHRRRYPDVERPLRIPLVPLLPALGILANLGLLSHSLRQAEPAIMAGTCLLLGGVGLLVWKGAQPASEALPGEPSRVVLVQAAPVPGRFRVLVPLANPANAANLVDLAAAIAGEREGEIVALRVIQVPEQLPPARGARYVERERRVLETAQARGSKLGIPVTSVVRIGHHVARSILEAARERGCQVILLGWKGYTSTARRILGDVVDAVVRHARSDLLLVKLVGGTTVGEYRRLLLPTAGGEHARRAEQYAAALARNTGGSLTLCGVVPPQASPEEVAATRERLEEAVSRVRQMGGVPAEARVLRHRSVIVGILQEAQAYDAVVVGAAGQSVKPQILFGSIPENIARHSDRPVLVVKKYHPVKALLGRVMEE